MGTYTAWSACSLLCGGGGDQWREWQATNCATPSQREVRDCVPSSPLPSCDDACVAELGTAAALVSMAIASATDGLSGPRDVAFAPTPGLQLGAFAEGRAFETGPDEAWVANAYGHSVSIVTAVGASTPSVLTRRDRGWYHYMVNISALAFAGPSETNGNGYFATCQANSNDYTGLKDPNYFQGPSLYSLSNEHPNLVNAAGDECAEGEQGAAWSYRYVKKHHA